MGQWWSSRRPTPLRNVAEPPTEVDGIPYASVMGGVAIVRGQKQIEALHTADECFGTVKLAPGPQDPLYPASFELRLTLEEEHYLQKSGRLKVERTLELGDRYKVYEYMKGKGFVVKNGIQFGVDFLLYRGSPDQYHAEWCCLVVDGPVPWSKIKTIARLAQDVRKRLVLCQVHEERVYEITIEDTFQKPPDVIASKKRKNKNADIASQARKKARLT